jgi:hypothetical protein
MRTMNNSVTLKFRGGTQSLGTERTCPSSTGRARKEKGEKNKLKNNNTGKGETKLKYTLK